jgi:hypothetical protein
MLGRDGRADAGGWKTLAGLQGHLIQGHTWEPLQDVRGRRLLSLFGTVEVRGPRFLPCRCAVTRHHTLNPVAESFPIGACPNTSASSRRRGPCSHTPGPGHCVDPTRHVLDGSIFRCASSMLRRRPRAGPTPRRRIARPAPACAKQLSGSAGGCGMARSDAVSISSAKPRDARSQDSFAGHRSRAESGAPSRRTRNICVRASRYHHRLCDSQAARGANLDDGHGKHGAMAAAPSDERPTADALDTARRASDANGPMRGDEWYARTRSHRRRTMGSSAVPERGTPPGLRRFLCDIQHRCRCR